MGSRLVISLSDILAAVFDVERARFLKCDAQVSEQVQLQLE